MNGRRNFTAGARHSAIRDEGNLESPVLQNTQWRTQFVKLRHPVGRWPLEPDNDHYVSFQLACLESGHDIILIVKDPGRRFDGPTGLINRTGFHRCPAEIALQETQAAVGFERVANGL